MGGMQDIRARAQLLYVTYYGRPADPGGLRFWAGRFAQDDGVDAALAAFGESPEYQALAGTGRQPANAFAVLMG